MKTITNALWVLACCAWFYAGLRCARPELCREIAGKSAEIHEGHCYQRREDGSLVPVKAGEQ